MCSATINAKRQHKLRRRKRARRWHISGGVITWGASPALLCRLRANSCVLNAKGAERKKSHRAQRCILARQLRSVTYPPGPPDRPRWNIAREKLYQNSHAMIKDARGEVPDRQLVFRVAVVMATALSSVRMT